jgi:hypothetical protein
MFELCGVNMQSNLATGSRRAQNRVNRTVNASGHQGGLNLNRGREDQEEMNNRKIVALPEKKSFTYQGVLCKGK